jgi:hypothetical protein
VFRAKEYSHTNLLSWKNICLKKEIFNKKNCENIVTIACNMKGCFKVFFFIFIFWISPNLAKCTYNRWSSLEKKHHKIDEKIEIEPIFRFQRTCSFGFLKIFKEVKQVVAHERAVQGSLTGSLIFENRQLGLCSFTHSFDL